MAKSEIMIDNKKTRVTRWSFEPGEDTGEHIHEYDYEYDFLLYLL